jgi:glycosyltransferase involved in cell wall biosynthesis
MRILFLNAYFFPEKIAFSHLEQDLIEGFLTDGHEICVLCPTPTRGISMETARQYSKVKEEFLYDGRVQVKRFWAPREGCNPIVRAFRYIWCNFRQYQIGKKYKGLDIIFAVSTPPTQGFLGGKLCKKLNCSMIYNLQDVFPDSLVTTGLAKKDSLLWKIGRKIEDYTYRNADKIIVISNAMKENILAKGVPEEKIAVIPNWIDVESVKPVDKQNNRLFEEYSIDNEKFTVVYAGNLGAAQGADVVLEAAKMLPDIQFVIFGGGAGFEKAKQEATKLPNVIVHPLLPQERVPEVYSLGDICLITCKKGVGSSGMPSKTWSIMACNRPIVAAFDTDSELSEILKSANAGICVEPENAELLAQAIWEMKNACDKYTGGRDYVRKYASKIVCVDKYIEILQHEI